MEKTLKTDLDATIWVEDLKAGIAELLNNDTYDHSEIRIALEKGVYRVQAYVKSDTDSFEFAEAGHINEYGNLIKDDRALYLR